MDTQKTILAVALSVIVLLLFQAWMERESPHPPAGTVATTQSTSSPAAATPIAAPPPATVAQTPTPAGLSLGGPSVPFQTRVFTGQIALHGGGIEALGLRDYPVSVDNPAPYPLLDTQPQRLTVQQSGFVASNGTVLEPQYTAPPHHGPLGREPITLSGGVGPLKVEKTLIFQPDSYVVEERIQVTNTGTTPWSGSYFDQILRNGREESHWFMSIFTGAVLQHDGSFSKESFSDLRSHPVVRQGPGWAGMMDHYFLTAVLPAKGSPSQVYARPVGENYAAGVTLALPTLAPGQSTTIQQEFFFGPKLQQTLAGLGQGLEQTVDYGWFAVIAEPMHSLLNWFHGLTGNWGLAIVLLVVVVKALFFYPSAISYRSMANMRKLQPKLDQIRKDCGDDRQKMGPAMMELYRSEKVNPMAGCLPIFIQMPVFISLYWVLVESVSLRQAPFILWIHDLAAPDPYYILPLLMGVSMFIQQRLNPAPSDPMQKRLMSALPVVFAVFFSFFPAGLVLYWLVNNLISIGQQYFITRRILAST
ncbi:membrane protein insertase YidC [Acidithiobacillus sp.]